MTEPTPSGPSVRPSAPADFHLLCLFALGVAAVHVATNGRYGFHRDELQFLDDARHFAFGYVAYPPVTPWIERVAFTLAGPSLIGLRMFSVLAQAVVLVLTGLMARELGGGRFAQIVAAVAVAISPLELFDGTEFQYTSFDCFWWVLTAYLMIRLLRSGDARLWLGIGAVIGIGMMTKYTMAFFVAGIVGGVLITPARRYLKSPWLWCGAALAVLIFLPNLIWQIHHHFITLDFLRHVHARDVGEGRAAGFWRDQFLVSTNLFAVPLWIAGLIYVWARSEGKPYRILGWMFAIPFALFVIDKGRGYYQAAAYPMLFAAGAVWEERSDGVAQDGMEACRAGRDFRAAGGRRRGLCSDQSADLSRELSSKHRHQNKWRVARRGGMARNGSNNCEHTRYPAAGGAKPTRDSRG